MQLLAHILHSNGRMSGFNNMGYDWPLLDVLWQSQGHVTHEQLYAKSQAIFSSFNRFEHIIWQPAIPQVDLYKIHHFDNQAKSTSLKLLEFNMRMDDIQELPFDPKYPVTYDQSRFLLKYNHHDVKATREFFHETKGDIELRDKLSQEHGKDFTNFNDSKIGSEFFIIKLREAGVKVDKHTSRTFRSEIDLSEIVLPYIQFETPEFQRILNQFKNTVITNTKGGLTGFECTVDGLVYKFGTGGLHAATNNERYYSNEYEVVEMRDVVSYYPNLSIKNRFYPEHLGEVFCDVYEDLFITRNTIYTKKAYPKENKVFKLALNGTFGNSNSEFSVFYDPKFTMSITVNGQLLLAMLCEQLLKVPGLKIFNVNTDGIGFVSPRVHAEQINIICAWWEGATKLTLERDEFKQFHQRDCNNYIAVQDDVKRKGAYEYNMQWHQNQSALVVPKAAEAYLVHGIPTSEFIRNHSDVMDFMLRTKVPRAAKLIGRTSEGDTPLQNITRYYVSNSGVKLVKIMKPTPVQIENWAALPHWFHEDTGQHKCSAKPPSGKYRIGIAPSATPLDREISIESAYLVTPCNNMQGSVITDINYDYYITEADKLCLDT